jgi:hypothetical protein
MWIVVDRESMELGVAGREKEWLEMILAEQAGGGQQLVLASNTPTPADVTETWLLGLGQCTQFPQVKARICTEDEREACMERRAETQRRALAQASACPLLMVAIRVERLEYEENGGGEYEAEYLQECALNGLYELLEGRALGCRGVWKQRRRDMYVFYS